MNSLERDISRKLAPVVKAAGFSLKAKQNAFVRETPYGCDILRIVDQGTAAPGPRHHQVSIHCAIRHNVVEVPWNTLGLVYGDAQTETATLVLGFPRGLAAPKLKVYTDTRDADVERVGLEGISIFQEIALPFYSRFADLSELERLANQRPLEDMLPYTIGLAMEHRAFRSLILAKLVHPSRYDQIRQQFLDRNIGTFPPAQRLAMLKKVDSMVLVPEGAR